MLTLFIKRSLLFGFCVIVMCSLLEVVLLFQNNEYSYKRRYVEEQGDAIKVLILGHSHSCYGLNPAILGDSTFNMAISGRLHHYDAVIAEKYLPTLPNLKVVIWPLGYNFQYISYKYPQYKNQYRTFYQCMYEKYMGISYESTIPYLHWSEVLNSHMDLLKRITGSESDKRECGLDGYSPVKKKRSADWQQKKLPEAPDYSNPETALAFEEGITDFKQIASACKDANVRLIAVSFPCFQTAREKYTERGLKERIQCLDSMRSVYPGMEYIDFIDDTRFTEDDFFDSTHLNPQGADKLSRILRETLQL